MNAEISHNLQTACFISLTYNRNNKGPKVDPWGSIQEYFSLIFTRKLLFERYDLKQFVERWESLGADIFLSKIS